MQTAQLKYDIIAWIAGLDDNSTIQKLHQWKEDHGVTKISTNGIIPPRRNGSLTEGFGFWADDAPFNETNYRDRLWQTGRSAW